MEQNKLNEFKRKLADLLEEYKVQISGSCYSAVLLTHGENDFIHEYDITPELLRRNLPEPNPEDFSISVSWCVEDVQAIAAEEEKELTVEQCVEILQDMENNYDANFGMTWDEIRTHVQNIE